MTDDIFSTITSRKVS